MVTGRAARIRDLLLVLLIGLFIYGWKLGDSPLDRTEPHRALVAHQMVQGSGWLVPRLFGELYLRKPPLIYWIQAATEKLLGRGDEFVWRLPSAVGSALLAVALAWWAGRWFGPLARLPAGVACIAIIATWEQNRGADIDALNTVAAVVTAMIVLEMTFTPAQLRSGAIVILSEARTRAQPKDLAPNPIEPRSAGEFIDSPAGSFDSGEYTCAQDDDRELARTAAWTIALAIAIFATLMLKGPGGLPPVIGALLGPAIVLRRWRHLRRPALWVGLLLGVAGFLAYGASVKARIRREGLSVDTAGVQEALQRIAIHDVHQLLPALAAPFITLFYAVPVSITLLYAVRLARREAPGDSRRQYIFALIGTIAAAMLVWIIAGNANPRYEYVALPLLAPLAGAVAATWREGRLLRTEQNQLRSLLAAFSVILVAATLVVTKSLWMKTTDRTSLAIAAIACLVLGALALVTWLRARYRAAGLASLVLILLLAVPLGDRKNIERRRKSAQNGAGQLRSAIEPGATISVASMLRDMPELFYYAGVNVHAFGELGLDKLVAAPGGQWVLLTENDRFPEYSAVINGIPNAFPRGVVKLKLPDPRDQVYVGWYEPPPGTPRVVKIMPRRWGPDGSSDE